MTRTCMYYYPRKITGTILVLTSNADQGSLLYQPKMLQNVVESEMKAELGNEAQFRPDV